MGLILRESYTYITRYRQGALTVSAIPPREHLPASRLKDQGDIIFKFRLYRLCRHIYCNFMECKEKQSLNRIFITGFPHCGTTILRKLIGNTSDTYDEFRETPFLTQEMIHDASHNHAAKNVVFKQPAFGGHLLTRLNPNNYPLAKHIFILRNPFDVFASLNLRFEKMEMVNEIQLWAHSIEIYGKCCEIFHYLKKNPVRNSFLLRYEDLFDTDHEDLKQLFKFLNLTWSDEILKNKRTGYVQTNDHNILKKDAHLNLRTNQINSPFTNMNGRNQAALRKEQIEKIFKSDAIKLAYPDLDKYYVLK